MWKFRKMLLKLTKAKSTSNGPNLCSCESKSTPAEAKKKRKKNKSRGWKSMEVHRPTSSLDLTRDQPSSSRVNWFDRSVSKTSLPMGLDDPSCSPARRHESVARVQTRSLARACTYDIPDSRSDYSSPPVRREEPDTDRAVVETGSSSGRLLRVYACTTPETVGRAEGNIANANARVEKIEDPPARIETIVSRALASLFPSCRLTSPIWKSAVATSKQLRENSVELFALLRSMKQNNRE